MSKKKSLSAPAAAWWFVASALLLTAAPETPKIRIGGNVQATRIVSQVKPVYPPEPKAARIQGTV
jgi:hypothetical protein